MVQQGDATCKHNGALRVLTYHSCGVPLNWPVTLLYRLFHWKGRFFTAKNDFRRRQKTPNPWQDAIWSW